MTRSVDTLEFQRLADLHRHRILDTLPEATFDRAVRLAASHFRVPIALVNFVDGQRQWTKAAHGLDLTSVDRSVSFCAHVVDGQGGALVVPDARHDPRFSGSPLVLGEPWVRFYAGAPVRSAAGHTLGTLCVIDRVPREFDDADVEFLEQCAELISAQLRPRPAAPGPLDLLGSFERSPQVVVLFDQHLRVQFTNSAARRLYGTDDDTAALPDREPFTFRWESAAHERTVRDALSTGGSWSGDCTHVLRDGREVRVHLHLSPTIDELGEPGGILGLVRDVTAERERTRLTELLLGSVAVNLSDAVVITPAVPADAPDGPGITYVNEAFCQMTGYEPEEVLGRSPAFLQGPATDRAELARIRSALGCWQPVTAELVNYRKDGSAYTVQLSIVPAGDEGGRFTHWVSIQRDVTEQRAQEERLRLLESVVLHASDAIVITEAEPFDEPSPSVRFVNDAYTRMTGYTAQEVMGKSPRIAQGPGTDRATLDRIRARLKAWKPVDETVLNYRKDGRPFWVSLAITPVANESGWFTHWVSIQRDVTRQKLQHDLDRDRRRILEMIAEGEPLPDVLRALLELLENQLGGMTGSVLLLQGQQLHEAIASRLPLDLREALNGITIGPDVTACAAAAHAKVTVIADDVRSSPQWREHRHLAVEQGLLACWSAPILSENRTVLGTLAAYAAEPRKPSAEELQLLEDTAGFTAVILERYLALDEKQQLVLYDPLTGLPNRVLFAEMLKKATADQSGGESVMVGLLDVDRFKTVNDSLGHSVGDELLCVIARRLEQRVGRLGTVSRMSGDEFTLIFPGVQSDEQQQQLAQRVLDAFREPFEVAGQELFVQGSLGFASYPRDAQSQEDLLRLADIAMYHAKRRNLGWAAFGEDTSAPVARHVALEGALNRALERDELSLNYQPIVGALDEGVVAVEALLRWNSAEFGAVSPAEFIPIAETTGLIIPIGGWVLRRACLDAAAMQLARPGLRFGVNLSIRQFNHPQLVGQVRSALEEARLNPDLLTLEITESVLMDSGDAISKIRELRALGVRLAIDDFGTGYSSLGYLRHIPVQAIKIDRSFIETVDRDPNGLDARITLSVVHLCRSLGLRMIAEGVETRAQADFLRGAGVHLLQGWLFSRAVPLEELKEFVAARPASP